MKPKRGHDFSTMSPCSYLMLASVAREGNWGDVTGWKSKGGKKASETGLEPATLRLEV